MTFIPIPILTSLASVPNAYDAWLCDIWGVLHNGTTALPGAGEACAAFRRQGGRVVLVSNAPRPASAVAAQLTTLGIGADCYDAILTSGDMTRTMLQTMPPQRVFLLGPTRHLGLVQNLGHSIVTARDGLVDETAIDLIVCSGLFETDASEQPDDYRPLLQRLQARGLTLICANPDLTADAGGTIIVCAGSLAALYDQMGGTVVYAGKPHGIIYSAARKLLTSLTGRTLQNARILAIGDGVDTDIRGANTEGLPAVYIASRVHLSEPFDAGSVARLFASRPFKPVAAMSGLHY
jgi:HAD superfamily hydrolase (TIGR01459 family)